MEEIYANVEFEKPVDPRPSTSQTGPTSSARRFHGAVVLCLVLLSAFLLAGLIGLSVHHCASVRDSAADLSAIEANLTERLQASDDKLSSMSAELVRLQSLIKQKKTCPARWRMFSCSCYYISDKSDSWEKGREDCRDRGADLVIIDSSKEQKFLSNIINQDTWIGLNDRDKEGTWKWIDETPLTLMEQTGYWADRQPDNGGGSPKWGEEDCVHLEGGTRKWNDRRCDVSLQWICEKNVSTFK